MTGEAQPQPGLLWIKNMWKFRNNPFPATGVARIGGADARENGLLYEPDVHAEQLRQVIDKFVLGMSHSGLKFGFLWSEGATASDFDARGFGKSVLMQHVAREINDQFGAKVYLSAGLDEEDAAEIPICCLLAGFDTAQVRTLGAVLFAAVEYAVATVAKDGTTLVGRLRQELISTAHTTDAKELAATVVNGHRALRGRTLGPPDEKLIAALCSSNPADAADYLMRVSPTTRSRNGAVHMATFLLFAAAAGVKHVLLFCDQLEDLASTTTAKAKRDLEIERFRDVIVETLPMADMVTVIMTMHPRAALTIGAAWDLADLPSFTLTDQNERSTVKLSPLRDAEQTAQLLRPYLVAATKPEASRSDDELFPFTREAIACLFSLSSRKPRDVLRKAHAVLDAAAVRNLERIEAEDVLRYFDATAPRPRDSFGLTSGALDWSRK
ncbi:hypothetical protein [Streptomyces sp. NPDC014894]|uniref:hypothetical protein n=1 Tax=Streptomyces sp. NPDC014894 TaxID=3364931 RepID=UPI0036FA2E7B